MKRPRDGALEVVGCFPSDGAGGPPRWRWRIPAGPHSEFAGGCFGRTKSEARADAKRRLGFGRRRLPVGTFLYRIA